MACIHRPQIRVKMRSSARFRVAGMSCAVFLLGPMSVIAVGTSAAPAFGAVGNRANAPRRLEEGNVTAIFNNTTDEEVIVAQHNIFDRSDSEQIPILDARQGGSGSSSSKGSKGSGSDSSGKGSTSKTSKGVGSASASNTGTTGDGKSKKSSGGDTKKAGRTKSSSSSKSDDESDDGDKKASSSSRSSAKTDLSSSKDKSSNSKNNKKERTNSQRMCNKKSEKACRNSCIDKRCGPSDDDGHDECAKRCRYKCCSDPHGDAEDEDEDEDADDERSCNTSKEKSCRNKCFHRKMCRDDECKRQCRRDCCVGGRVGGGGGSSSSNGKKKKQKNKSNKSKKAVAKDKGAGPDDDDGGDDEDGKGCDTDVEKQCRDTCYADSSCKDGDTKCRKTCRKGCCDISDISIVDIMSNTQDGGAGDDSSLMTGDVFLSFRFTINTSERLTADDIMNGRDNSLKDDLEGGLKILVEDIVGEMFRDDRWKKETSSRHRLRKLVVRYQSSSPPSVEGVQDVCK